MPEATEDAAVTLLTLGGLFLVGLLTDLLGRRTALPRVTLLVVFGFAVGPSALDLLPDLGDAWFPTVANVALLMVGFLVGGSLTADAFRRHGRTVIVASLAIVAATAAVTAAGLAALGVPVATALLLAGIACATDPAATVEVVRESGARGPFSEILVGVVAIDDAWGVIAFSLLLVAAGGLAGQGTGSDLDAALHGLWEVGGALALGVALGIPLAYLTGRVRPGEPTLVEALGAVFLCGGVALAIEVSYLLAAMTLGAVVVNLARHHRRPFHAIEGIEWPFMILFFVLAGASLRVDALAAAGLAGAGYFALRVAGRLLGGWGGARLAGLPAREGGWLGAALLPQAGVALGMALVAEQRFPGAGEVILPVVIGATVAFEIAGPLVTRVALARVGAIAERGGG